MYTKTQRKSVEFRDDFAQKTEKSNNFVKKTVFFLEVIIIFCIFATEDLTTSYICFQYIDPYFYYNT